ncbi:MAG: PAAR-like domain-containing protein [Burkholderiales bacterium]
MANVFVNQRGIVHKSGYQGASVGAFPDVCRTPAPGPVSIPYTNLANPAATKQARSQQLRGKLQTLHMQIASLPSGDPTRWHRLLDEYVVVTAELYKTVSE